LRAGEAMPHLSFATLAHTRHGNTLMVAGAMLALGVVAGATMRSSLMPKATAPVELAHAATNEPAPSATPMTRRLDPSLVYPPRCCASSTATRSRRGCGCGRGSTLTPRCGCAASMRRSCMRVATTSASRRKRHARPCRRFWPKAVSPFRRSASTNTTAGGGVAGAEADVYRVTPPTCRRRRSHHPANLPRKPVRGGTRPALATGR